MVSIIGAGITGLVAADGLHSKGIPVQVFEGKDRVGGNIYSHREGPYLLESGPNSLLINDALFRWLKSLRLSSTILWPKPEAKYRYVLKEGKYHRIPGGPVSLLGSPLLGLGSKVKALKALRKTSGSGADDTVDAFFRTRLGDEITDYLVYPFIAGIYAGDPAQLLVDQAFPQLRQGEASQGSFIRAMMRQRKGQVHTGSMSFPGGLGRLCQALERRLEGQIHLDQAVEEVSAHPRGYALSMPDGGWVSRHVIIATPAYAAGQMLQSLNPGLARALHQVYYPPVAVVHTAYPRTEVAHPLNGFGALHNRLEPSFSLGTLFSSSIFPGRCPADEVLLTTFVGGTLAPEKALLPAAQIQEGVTEDHRRLLGVTGAPTFQQVYVWEKAIPQYDARILDVQPYLEPLEKEGLWLAGNWVGGISLGASIQRGRQIARAVAEYY